ncbi:MAG: hypothetical protein CM1200mP28_17140 [Deltaproteobacteria bacterium]|nr:MAG: hypothetical protein CM1200mP28_17140 [Deltaproteobacteria bacterium]
MEEIVRIPKDMRCFVYNSQQFSAGSDPEGIKAIDAPQNAPQGYTVEFCTVQLFQAVPPNLLRP